MHAVMSRRVVVRGADDPRQPRLFDFHSEPNSNACDGIDRQA